MRPRTQKKPRRKAGKVLRVYTIGKKGKEFGEFFAALNKVGVTRLIDIRRHNTWEVSAGFTVKARLPGHLKDECGAEYIHELLLAPSAELLRAYQDERIDWPKYRKEFLVQLAERKVEEKIQPNLFDVPTVILCACATPDQCHRSLVLEYLQSKWPKVKLEAVHL